MRAVHRPLSLVLASLVLVACGTSVSKVPAGASGAGQAASGSSTTGVAASGSTATGAGAGTSGTSLAGSTSATGVNATGSSAGAGSGATGSSAGAGTGVTTGSSTGAAAGATGSSTGGGNDGGSGASTNMDAATGRGGEAGPLTTAGCSNHNYPLCIDFENGIDANVWTGGTPGAIVTDDFAHGTHSYRLYPMSGGTLKTTKMGTIKDQVYGRFYVHFKPGAPGGHGAIVGIFDQSNNWYEIGWQFDGIMGVWHASNNGERPLRSQPYIVDQWYCIEYFFDGSTGAFPVWWIDGQVPMYNMAANTTLIPKVVTQFTNLFIGFTPYAGLGLQKPDGQLPIDNRVLTNMWIDDIALDTQRIGCIQ